MDQNNRIELFGRELRRFYDVLGHFNNATVAGFGRLYMACNNAGILGTMCDMSAATAGGHDAVQAVHLRGIWTFIKHELLQMKKQGCGAIVNCSSVCGLVGLSGTRRITRASTASSD